MISVKLLYNFTEITLRHGCFTANFLHISRAPFPKNTSRRLLLFFLVGLMQFTFIEKHREDLDRSKITSTFLYIPFSYHIYSYNFTFLYYFLFLYVHFYILVSTYLLISHLFIYLKIYIHIL